ncbi:hypothetical protein Tco_0420430 [Tanacetum coccineum]
MAGLQCNKFRGDNGKIILVLRIRAMLLAQREILQMDRQELLNATTARMKDIWLGNALSLSDQGMQCGIRRKLLLAKLGTCGQILDVEPYGISCSRYSHSSSVKLRQIIPHICCFRMILWNLDVPLMDILTMMPHNCRFYYTLCSHYRIQKHDSYGNISNMVLLSLSLNDFEQSPVMDFTDNEISSDSNIIPILNIARKHTTWLTVHVF